MGCHPTGPRWLLPVLLAACATGGGTKDPWREPATKRPEVECAVVTADASTCLSAAEACAAVSEVKLSCSRGTYLEPVLLPERGAVAAVVGDRKLLLLDLATLSASWLPLPRPAARAKIFGTREALWLAVREEAGNNLLLEYRGGWAEVPIVLPPGSRPPQVYADVVAVREGSSGGPHVWLVARGTQVFEAVLPGAAVSSSGVPAQPEPGRPLRPDAETLEAVPPGTKRAPKDARPSPEAEAQCRGVKALSEVVDQRKAESRVQLEDGRTWVAVRRSHEVQRMRQKRMERPIMPIDGRPPPDRIFECVWDQEEVELERVLALATVEGGYAEHLVLSGGELLGSAGTDLVLSLPDPKSNYEAPRVSIVKVDTRRLSQPSPGPSPR